MKLFTVCAFFCGVTSPLYAQDFQGAAAILRQLAEKERAAPAAGGTVVSAEELRDKLTALRREGAALPPAEAAERWVELFQAYMLLPANTTMAEAGDASEIPDLSAVLTALPLTAAWDEIGDRLARSRPYGYLQAGAADVLIAVLRGDKTAWKRALEEMRRTAAAQTDSNSQYHKSIIAMLADQLGSLTDTDAEKLESFEKRLAEVEKREQSQERSPLGRSGTIPDLVRLAGEKTAADLLTRVLRAGWGDMSMEGESTKRLAAALALQQIEALPQPLWELVETLDDAPLYEAMRKRFPKAELRSDHDQASGIYLLALIAGDRVDDAWAHLLAETVRLGPGDAVSLKAGDIEQMEKQGLGARVLAFLRRALSERPEMAYWEDFITLSARRHESAAALQLMRETLAKPGLTPGGGAEIRRHFSLALLAAEERDEGIQVLRELVKAGPGEGTKGKMRQWLQQLKDTGVTPTPEMISRVETGIEQSGGNGVSDYLEVCSRLAKLGNLLQRPELIDEALNAATLCVEGIPISADNREDYVVELITPLSENGRGAKAEEMIAAQLGYLVTPGGEERGGWNGDSLLERLAELYDEAERPADVLAVLEQSPLWSEKDLAEKETLWLPAARALAATGRLEEARRVLKRELERSPGEDRAYELLLRIGGSDLPVTPLLDKLAAENRFEERPLIWKASVLLEAGKIDEAEKAARAAIAIDPSDGEQGKGDRMRAYAVLAGILEKKGDPETAATMRGAVSAIRKSEDADDWWSAGLLSEAVRRYESALTDFADAYCIQSRLALVYSERGDDTKAEQHYIRAFELMPDSFGRVESHCFGCEGAFRGSRAQNAADKVFTRLAATPPVKAQVYYLLGYLRDAQDRKAEASIAYGRAVRTDPDYLNAWRKLEGLAGTGVLTPEESDAARLNVYRLDPSSSILSDVRNLRGLWDTVLAVEKNLPVPETGPLLPLTAAKARLDAQNSENLRGADRWSFFRNSRRPASPRENIVKNNIIRIVVGFIEGLKRL